jgi:hypothetical protein
VQLDEATILYIYGRMCSHLLFILSQILYTNSSIIIASDRLLIMLLFHVTFTGRIGAVTAQFVNGSLEANVGVLLFVTSTCMIVGGAFVFGLPNDPSGSNLDDSIEESPGNINKRSELLTPDLGPGEERDQLSPKTSEFYPSKPKNPSEKKRKQKNGPDKTYNVVPLSDQGQ